MKFSKYDLRTISIAMRLFQTIYPEYDELDEILDNCQAAFNIDELHEIGNEMDSIMESEELREFAKKILNK